MLQSINDKIQGWLGWFIVILISVPFALWGIQQYVGGGNDRIAAKVNDVEISIQDFDRAVSQQRARLQQLFGKNMPQDAAYDAMLKQQVLDQLITNEVLNQAVNNKGFQISNEKLSTAIKAIESFKEDGAFAQPLYERIINSQGMSVAGFEKLYRQELVANQYRDAISESAFVTRRDAALNQKLNEQTRNISYVTFKPEAYLNKVDVTEDEINAYYQEQKQRFMNPEKVSINYIELKLSDLANEVPVSEDELKKAYNDYVQTQKNNEERKASHILINVAADASKEDEQAALDKIKDIQAQLKQGKSFASLAEQYSEDVGSAKQGGDLGWVTRGAMVKPFEDSLFALNKSAVSEPVRSEFGYHLIKLEDIKIPEIKSYADKKQDLQKDQQASALETLFYDRAEKLANLAYENPESLDIVSEQMGLPVKSTALFSQNSGEGIAGETKVRQAAFSDEVLNEKLNSNAVELSNRHVLVLRVKDHVPASVKPLEEIRKLVVANLKTRKAAALSHDAAKALYVKLNETPENWQNVLKESGLAITNHENIKRTAKDLDRILVGSAFRLSKPAENKVSYKQVELSNDNTAILVVSKVNDSDSKEIAKDDAFAKSRATAVSQQEMAAAIAYLRSQAEIYIPKKKQDNP